jgi:Tol biopolymer transport system component
LTTQPSLSADGRLIAYASNRRGEGNLDVYVQQTTGGTAIPLTNDPADDHEPDVSPDGSLVAFRSERAPSGIYVAPALGGTARLIAPGGRSPRFSPDGRLVAFDTGLALAPIDVYYERKIFVVPATGGPPLRLATNLVNAGDPVWAPDGKSLLVLGRKGRSGPDVALDWWRVPLEPDAPAVQSGVFGQLADQGFRMELDTVTIPSPRAWTSDGVFFSATTGGGDTLSVWRVGVDQTTGRSTAPPVRLTQGTTLDTGSAISRDGRLVWAARTSVESHFGIPLDANGGKATGGLMKLHDDSVPSGRSAISQDGHLLIFPRYEVASGALWARDLRTAREWQLSATPRTPLNPAISPDSRWVGYTVTTIQTGGSAGFGDGYVIGTVGGAPRQMCEKCEVTAWTRDGQLVFSVDDHRRLVRVNLETGDRRDLIVGQSNLDRPLFGPNGTWMVFNMDGRIVRAPVHSDRATMESDWTTLLKVGRTERTAGLSPDGGVLYVLLESDGFRCVYGLRLDPATGQPRGEPFIVAHIHDATLRWGTTGYGSAVATGLFVADLYETRGNIWTAQLVRGGVASGK